MAATDTRNRLATKLKVKTFELFYFLYAPRFSVKCLQRDESKCKITKSNYRHGIILYA